MILENHMARRKKESGLDTFFHFLVKMPWWIGPICAMLFFVLLRFIIPAILENVGKPDDSMTKSFNIVLAPMSTKLAPLAGLLVFLIWGIAELKKLMDRKRLDNQTGLDSMSDLSWKEFEELVAEAYRREGYKVELTGNATGDGGIDIVLRRREQNTLVQCKHWKTWTVGVKIVRELRGVMASEKADYGIVVSYGTFTPETEAFAKENRITLIGGNDLDNMVKSVQRTRCAATKTTEPTSVPPNAAPQLMQTQGAPSCPLCTSVMVQRTARKGANAGNQFWGCLKFPACKGTRSM
jgi:restriction system protein